MKKTKYKRTIVIILCVIFTVYLMGGCSMQEAQEEKLKDLEFTVVTEAELPQALKDVIMEKKSKSFQISYTLGDDLYITAGYGEQASGGYSICVNELYETETNIVIDTTLMGPESQDQITDTPSFPYIVVKTENIDGKTVEFR